MLTLFKKFISSLLEECSISATSLDLPLFEAAFTHSSYKNIEPKATDYERLEILGDSFITLVITDKLYARGLSLKKISNMRKEVISGSSLSWVAKYLDFGKYIKMGGGCSMNDSILEDVYEGVVGAIYLNLGSDAAWKFVEYTLYDNYVNGKLLPDVDYKSKLQEKIQSMFKDNRLIYSLENRYRDDGGRDVFSVSVKLNNLVLGRGEGYRKKSAEQKSAENALIQFKTKGLDV